MRFQKILWIVLLFIIEIRVATAQELEQSILFFQLDNDLFFKRDQYYTNGVHINWYSHKQIDVPYAFVFWPHRETQVYFHSFHLKHELYTPTNIDTAIVLYGDRPYASTLYVKHQKTILDYHNEYQLRTSISIGAIGKHAFGEEVQNSIHAILPPAWPALGWDNQVASDILFSYEFNFKKKFIQYKEFGSTYNSELRIGFPESSAQVGLGFYYGNFDIFYGPLLLGKSERLFYACELHFNSKLVAYNSTLQGPWFNSDNVYKINWIYPFVFSSNFKVSLSYKAYILNFETVFQTAEFKNAKPHYWNGFGLGIRF